MPDRHARESAERTPCHDVGFDAFGFCAGEFGRRRAERMEQRFDALHAGDHGVNDFDR